jgi:hypothetical protein
MRSSRNRILDQSRILWKCGMSMRPQRAKAGSATVTQLPDSVRCRCFQDERRERRASRPSNRRPPGMRTRRIPGARIAPFRRVPRQRQRIVEPLPAHAAVRSPPGASRLRAGAEREKDAPIRLPVDREPIEARRRSTGLAFRRRAARAIHRKATDARCAKHPRSEASSLNSPRKVRCMRLW